MTQLSLFETSKQVSLTDEIIAVNFRGRWEMYIKDYYKDNGIGWDSWFERFSHFATPAESLELYRRKGG